MSAIKYLLDEHIDPRLRRALLEKSPGTVVWRIGDAGAPPFQASDPDILRWCEAHGFCLVTNNRASMPVHLRSHLTAGRHIPGIFMVKPGMSLADTADELALIGAVSEAEEYADTLSHLPLSR